MSQQYGEVILEQNALFVDKLHEATITLGYYYRAFAAISSYDHLLVGGPVAWYGEQPDEAVGREKTGGSSVNTTIMTWINSSKSDWGCEGKKKKSQDGDFATEQFNRL